ncbi:MAG: tetratricopeptide repeat protein [Terrimicrobiaceae bacterium]
MMLSSGFAEDSSDLFLKAYKDFAAGERLERESKPHDALKKYRTAQKILQQIAKSTPDWQPLVIEYRLRKTQENLLRLEGDLANLPAEPPEGELPQPDKEKSLPAVSTLPVVAVNPPVNPPLAPKRSVGEPARAAPPPRNGSTVREAPGVAEREIRDLRRQLSQARVENEQLNERLVKRSADLQSALVEVDKTKVSVVELKAQLAQASASLEDMKKEGVTLNDIRESLEKQYAGIFEKYTDLQTENEVLQEENERLFAKLERAADYIASSDKIRSGLLTERRELDGARDAALAKVKKIKDNSAEIERVNKENKRLKGELAESSQNTVSKSEFEKLAAEKKALAAKQNANSAVIVQKDEAIAALQNNLRAANEALFEAQTQISSGDEELSQLREQLDETSGQLAQLEMNPSDERKLAMENELLRGIILRQIKEQTKRDEARKRIEQEIATLNVESKLIMQQLAVLGTPVVQLTPNESSAFKEPASLITESDNQSLEVTVAISKQDTPKQDVAGQDVAEPDVAEQDAPKQDAPKQDAPKQDVAGQDVAKPDVAKPDGPKQEAPHEVTTKRVLQEPSQAESLPEQVRELVRQAKGLFESKNYADAEKIYQRLVERIPNSYFVLSNLGVVQIESGKLSDAEVALKKAVGINGNNSYAYTNLGIAYSRQGKFDEAIGALHKAVSFNESNAVAHNYLGVCLGQEEQWNEAEVQLKRAVELKPEYSDAHFNLAVLYATTEPPSLHLAKEHYVKATALGAAPDASLERLIQ